MNKLVTTCYAQLVIILFFFFIKKLYPTYNSLYNLYNKEYTFVLLKLTLRTYTNNQCNGYKANDSGN